MSQPPLHHKGEEEAHCCDRTANDEKRFEDIGPNVGYVRNIPLHANILWPPLSEPGDEHCKECTFPHEGREDGDPYVVPVGVKGGEAAHG